MFHSYGSYSSYGRSPDKNGWDISGRNLGKPRPWRSAPNTWPKHGDISAEMDISHDSSRKIKRPKVAS